MVALIPIPQFENKCAKQEALKEQPLDLRALIGETVTEVTIVPLAHSEALQGQTNKLDFSVFSS